MTDSLEKLGFVAIGRNEGERFKRCLKSLQREGKRIVYVDSGSVDDSAAFARGKGCEVVELSMDRPFTAARARNAGFDALLNKWADTEYVMFIDGDCALTPGFSAAAAQAFDENPAIGIVTGRCREMFPERTVYNRLCDMEWNGPVGEIDACGGIFMTRTTAFRRVKGFNENVIAAEDDDFCIRVRNAQHKVVRIDHDMCLHDADISKFTQWWRRMERSGHAFMQVGELHRGYFKAERRRAWIWGGALPALALLAAPFSLGASIVFAILLYGVSFARARSGLISAGEATDHAGIGATFMTLAKFPTLVGMLKYRFTRGVGKKPEIVEYK